MGDILQFPEKEKVVELLTCSECESGAFHIHVNLRVECSTCHHITGNLDEILDFLLDHTK